MYSMGIPGTKRVIFRSRIRSHHFGPIPKFYKSDVFIPKVRSHQKPAETLKYTSFKAYVYDIHVRIMYVSSYTSFFQFSPLFMVRFPPISSFLLFFFYRTLFTVIPFLFPFISIRFEVPLRGMMISTCSPSLVHMHHLLILISLHLYIFLSFLYKILSSIVRGIYSVSPSIRSKA
jgi:hypothetical protein